jgi:two-component system sensor histidine kinase BarA
MMNNDNEPAKKTPCKVLLVDDNHDVASLITEHLRDPQISLTVSTSGPEGIQAFQREPFDVVLMDLQMPGMDGYEATRAIRFWERQKHLRPAAIAALTASTSSEALSDLFVAGCDIYLPKPVTRNVLLQTVGQYFTKSRGVPDEAAAVSGQLYGQRAGSIKT